MIGIFNNKTTKADLTLYNGEYILETVCTSYEITEELNGEYSLDITFLISDKINKNAYDLMVNDSLLKVDDEYGIEYFRIAKVTKTKTKYEIFARHITISEPLKMFLEDVRPTGLNGQGAISWIFDNARGNKWLEVTSNIANINTAYYKNKNVYEALFDSDNSFLDRWGGEVYRRGFRLSINTKVGEDRGFSIRSGKNLKGIEERSNLNTLVTSIYPVGFDGISIPEKCIDSPLINYYSDIYPKEVKFDDVKVKSENNKEGFNTLEEAQEELRRRVREMFTKDKVDILTSSYTVTFAELQKAEGYKDYSFLETTFLGDIVSVFEEKLGIDIKVRVTKRVYDGIKKKRKSTTLSNKDLNYKPPSITQIIEKINNVDSTETILQLAKDNATALIKSGLKNSHVIVKENEILIGDTKDINTMTKVWRWNNGGLGYSSTGYFGQFGTAITNDGSIVADFITVGILNAVLIKTGVLKSFNNITWINMDNGTFNFAEKIKFDGTSFSIDLSNEDLTTNESIKTTLKIMNDSIISKVSNGDFNTYKEQTANSISQKVSNGDFNTYKEQTANSISQKVSNGDFNTYKEQTENNISQKVSSGKEFATEFGQNSEEFNYDIGNGTMNVSMNKYGVNIRNGAIKIFDNYGNVVLQGDSNGNLTFKGKLQPNDYQLKLFGNDCRIDGSAGAIRLQLTPQIYMAMDNEGAFRIYNQYSEGGTEYISLKLESDNHLSLYNTKTRLKLLGGVTPQVQARNTGDNAYVSIVGSEFINASSIKYKTDITDVSDVDFIKILKENNIKKYKFKEEVERLQNEMAFVDDNTQEGIKKYASEKIGLILEELTEEGKKYLNPNNTDGIDTYSMVSILWEAFKIQQQEIENLKFEMNGV